MSCVEKRHMSHRVGSMLHHRFPNGFTDLFMDDTDREVSTLTDRAFRSLCVGDDAVYNDEFLYGYSPFSCHKPLAGEPVKKTHHKEAKKQGQNKTEKNFTQSWTQQQHENLSQMSSLLKAFSATEESCEGMLIKNGAMTDIKGESWDKSALRSIQRELSEFSSDYPTNLTDGHYKHFHRHHSGDGPSTKTGKDAPPPSGKSSKNKNGKPNVKLRKLNITNFFLHSELSPFQTWKDFNRFPFGQEDTMLPTDSIPKWYDLPFYKELTEAHKQETQPAEEVQPGQKALEPPPSAAPKPIPPPPPPKVLPKPSATPAGKRCSSEVGDGTAAPWRRNKSRAKSAIPLNQPGVPPQENISKQVDESLFLLKKEARSVEVKAVEEVCSLASTPFSICQLMTPLIPSRQPTETSEILQAVLSPSALDLPLRPHSEAKSTPEPPVKRESYKSLASSILFNLKDNRKRVKSRYSPPKFKTLEVPEGDSQSPQSDSVKHSQAGSEGNGSRLSTPAVFKEGFTVCSPVLESNSSPSVGYPICDTDGPLSDDYLLSNLLQTKRETAGSEENPMSPLMHTKKTKSPMAVKQNYPSLNLYKKASSTDSDAKYLQVPPAAGAPVQINQPVETNKPSPIAINKERSPKTLPTIAGLSPNTLTVNKDSSPLISPNVLEKEGVSTNASARKIPPTIPDKPKQPIKELRETGMGLQPVTPKEKDTSVQPLSTKEVIRAAREAINAAKSRALVAAQSDRNDKTFKDKELRENEIGKKAENSKETFSIKSLVPENNSTGYQSRSDTTSDALLKTGDVKKEPPPVPKRHFVKSDIQLALDKQQANVTDEFTNDDSGNTSLDVPTKENESNRKQVKSKHIFSARQNNYIKYHRYAETDDEHGEESKEGDVKVNTRREADEEMVSPREVKDRAHLSNDLHALKELQRAKLGDRVLDNIRNRLGVFNIDDEAKAKNDLISRELRNIKKGMLSMRGNTTAKRDLFTKKEKEQIKPEAFTKIDSNVIVNKALINDNYDKAKMALEEIISERQKKNNQKEQDANPILDENVEDRSYVTRVQQRKQAMKDSAEDAGEKQTGYTNSLKESDVRERLDDLRDHNHIRNILSQTEPGHEEKSTNQTTLPGLNKTGNEPSSNTKTKSTFADDKLSNNPGFESEIKNLDRQLSEESGDSTVNQMGGIRKNVPPVPPRSKKGGSTTKETGSLKDFAEFDIFTNEEKCENGVERLKEMAAGSDKQEVVSDLFFKDPVHSPIETYADKKLWDRVPGAAYTFVPEADAFLTESDLPLQYPLSEDTICSSPEFRQEEIKANNFLSDKQTGDATLESSIEVPQVVNKVKRKAPLKPEYLKTVDNETKSLVEAGPDRISTAFEEMNTGREGHSESPSKMISPLLLVNGLSINQSPPDHASLSSKSSYFSVESALQRNTETESNVYLSLENLIGEMEGADEVKQITQLSTKRDSDRTEVEYYSLSDHESEPEFVRQAIKSPNKDETELPFKFIQAGDNASTEPQDEENQTPMSPSNTFSPALGIPALFKVKDNTFSNKLKKSIQPWSPRGSFSLPTKEEEVNQVREHPKVPLINEPTPDETTAIQDQTFKPKEILTNVSPPLLLSPPNLLTENPKKPQVGAFLAVPQEEDRFSGVSPCSEGVESVTSTVDTADEMGANDELLVEREVLKVPSERSGSTCSGNDSQTGLPKPPAVLPKSEKAVQRAMKLATRRMKKEEAQKTSQRSSHSSSKQRVSKHRGENPEHKSSSNSSKNSKSSERKHRERTEDGHSENHHDKDSKDLNVQHHERSHNSENPLNKKDLPQETRRQSQDSAASSNLSSEALPNAPTERQGRRSNKQIRDKPQQRHYSSDRVISNVPVYKAQVGDRTATERSFQRSMSSDRFLGDKVERRLSNDMTANERLDPRSQRIEKSIMEELQQRGRVRDKAPRDNPLRRSQSIDAYSTEVSHPSTLSRQSSHTSHTSQLSRQSSIEHAIVTQSFPMTQRKLLQDPDSGQYFFVDMPVQVKTKTFFDPETGSYVQLPVQPPEGAVPHASPLEVLTPPMVLYHGFVPVPLSPMAQKAPVQATQMAPEEFEQRHLEMSRQMLFQERHPYVEPVYGQHDHVLGEFLGTEELDCPS